MVLSLAVSGILTALKSLGEKRHHASISRNQPLGNKSVVSVFIGQILCLTFFLIKIKIVAMRVGEALKLWWVRVNVKALEAIKQIVRMKDIFFMVEDGIMSRYRP